VGVVAFIIICCLLCICFYCRRKHKRRRNRRLSIDRGNAEVIYLKQRPVIKESMPSQDMVIQVENPEHSLRLQRIHSNKKEFRYSTPVKRERVRSSQKKEERSDRRQASGDRVSAVLRESSFGKYHPRPYTEGNYATDIIPHKIMYVKTEPSSFRNIKIMNRHHNKSESSYEESDCHVEDEY
jgi:hypothetical protein